MTEQAASPVQIVLRIAVTSLGIQKALRCPVTDTVWDVKKQLMEKMVGTEIKDALNFGLFSPGKSGLLGKFLDEKKNLQAYGFENNV
jgi:hypothetical protein